MATGPGGRMMQFARRRPLLMGSVASAAVYAIFIRKRTSIPNGDIWLDVDLSTPLGTSTGGLNTTNLMTGNSDQLRVRDVVEALEMATKDRRVVGLMGRFNFHDWDSTALGCTQEVRDAVSKFRQAGNAPAKGGKGKRKFTMAVADSFGNESSAVGEYYLASAFEKIYIQRTGYVGFTGMGENRLFLKRFLDSWGIKVDVIAREEYKSLGQVLTDTQYSKVNREAATSLYRGLFDDVVEGVASSRDFKSKEEVYKVVNACPMPAAEALARNLIDGFMYPNEAEDMMNKALVGEEDADVADVTTTKLPSASAPTRVSMAEYIKHVKSIKSRGWSRAGGKIAVVELAGAIGRGRTVSSATGVTSGALCRVMKEIKDDPTFEAVVLRIESPGGSAIASDTIGAAIDDVRKAGKPVVCSMGDVAASGGYWIAAGCDEIVAMPTTITGSIGVLSMIPSFQGFLTMNGCDSDSVLVGDNHLALSFLQDVSPAQLKRMNESTDSIYKSFIQRVSEGRNIPFDKVREVARGRVWTGRQAQEVGLVDRLGGFTDAVVRCRKIAGLPDDAEVVQYYPSVQPFTQILSAIASRAISGGAGGPSKKDSAESLFVEITRALLGAEAMSGMFALKMLLTSLNDVTQGRVPTWVRRPAGGTELRLEDDDKWQK